MELRDLAHKKVALLGAGKENLSLLPILIKQQALVTICEQNASSIPQGFIEAFPNVKLQTGESELSNLQDFDVLVRSPGLPIKTVDKALIGATAQPLRTSVADLFLANTPCQVIGVTGTKGKGTTTTLISLLLNEAGKKAYVAGNIGTPIFDIYESLKEDDIVVLELSSFQLEDVTHSPQTAVILPITEDHLQPLSDRSPNYHETVEDYAAAKGNITAFQEPDNLLVYASDAPTTAAIASSSNARKIAVSANPGADLQVNEHGQVIYNGELLLDLSTSGLRGSHIFLDAALAVAVGREFGLTGEQMIQALRKYQPLPHRMQKVADINGATYVDDSYATAPDAAIAAINAYSDRPIIWIGGGSRKGVDFTELAKVVVSRNIKFVILLGEEAERLKGALVVAGYQADSISIVASMGAVVATARSGVASGDVVLLSPACASMDMFKSAEDRGEQFTKFVLS